MEARSAVRSDTAERELVQTRVINAPRDLVFKIFTDPKHLAHWWGPRGFSTTTLKMDFKVGGVWRFVMHGPDGRDYQNRVVYLEIDAPERIVFQHGAVDEIDNVTHLTTITLEEQGDKTKVSLIGLFSSREELERVVREYHADEGAKQNLERLDNYVANATKDKRNVVVTPLSEREFMIQRLVDAPRNLVFDAFTKPEHLPHWMLGPGGWTMPVCEIDLRPGGAWHFVRRKADGTEMEMRGVYREVVPNERIVNTESWGAEWQETVNTFSLTEVNGKTLVTISLYYPSKEARDAALKTGASEGMASGFVQLEEYLKSRSVQNMKSTSEREFVISRVINAPRELVYKAWSEPRHLAQWWGPHGFTNPVCELDVRPGGKYRVVMRSPEGVEYPIKGVFREVVPPERLVFTDDWSDHPEDWHEMLRKSLGSNDVKIVQEAVNTVTFENQVGKTLLTIRTLFETAQVRDAMVNMGMNDGWGQSLERLEAVVSKLR